MTLEKFNKLLEESKEFVYKRINDNPRELESAYGLWEGYFIGSLLEELFKSKDDPWNKKRHEAFKAWLEMDSEIRAIKYEKTYSDIIKEFHEGSLEIKTQKELTLPDQERH